MKNFGQVYHLITQEFVHIYKVENLDSFKEISYRSRPRGRHLVS